MTYSVADILARVMFRDQLVIILNKPTGITVHAGPKGGYSLEDHFTDLRFGYKETPQLAHRLDRDTSGCLILGRNARALKKLGRLFESGRITKTYWAITENAPEQDAGTIDTPLKKVKLKKGWSMQPAAADDPDAQTAHTDFKVRKRLPDGKAWLELFPKTGRTHQLRVHLKSIGCTIMGDWLYGGGPDRPADGAFPTLYLHARALDIPIYTDKPAITAEAPPPPHMADLIAE